MKRLASILTFAASAALVAPFAFPSAVEGCSDKSYRYRTSMSGQVADDAADLAKFGFCKTVSFYN